MARKKEGPDQAHSWIIAMAGFLLNGLVSGISRTTGLFYVALIETYGVSRMEANLPFTMRNMVRSFACPIAGLVGHRYGARGVIFTGGIFTFLGITLCTIAPSFTWICVFWGGMHAFGVALSYTLYPVIVNQYFLKYRATASGISSSGGCFGSFILPAVIEYLLNNIGLSGTFLITGGIIMHVLPASILMAEPSWTRNPILNTKRKEENTPNNLRTEAKNGNFPKNCEDISVVSIKNISSDFFSEERTSTEESFPPKGRDAKILDQNGLDNPAFVGSHLSLDEKTTAKIEDISEILSDLTMACSS